MSDRETNQRAVEALLNAVEDAVSLLRGTPVELQANLDLSISTEGFLVRIVVEEHRDA